MHLKASTHFLIEIVVIIALLTDLSALLKSSTIGIFPSTLPITTFFSEPGDNCLSGCLLAWEAVAILKIIPPVASLAVILEMSSTSIIDRFANFFLHVVVVAHETERASHIGFRYGGIEIKE